MKNLLYILLILTYFGANAQESPPLAGKLKILVTALDSFRANALIEKVHLHFDKPYYTLGDTIWLKAYVVNENNELSGLSNVLYADLIDGQDSVKTSLRLPLTSGLGWGAITLSDSLLHAGNYHIRAYTASMRGFGQEYFFNKSIKIGNALPPVSNGTSPVKIKTVVNKEAMIPVKKEPVDISLQFFPEGGELVNGIAAKIGFKAVGVDGLSRPIAGYILDKDNKPLTTFQSEHAGMGSFILQPDAGNTYTAVIKLADSSEKRVALPRVLQQGYALSVNQNEDNVLVGITASPGLLKGNEVSLVAQASNTVIYSGEKELAGTGVVTIIPKSRFPEGIVQFTLFGPDYRPVAERVVFIRNNTRHLNIKISTDKQEYKQRGKVHLGLEVTSPQGKPVMGAFSLAVTDEGKVPYAEADETTIFSNLLLNADLKGYIEHPNYYFADTTSDRGRQLDNLLLTQGWRRFVWNDIIAGKLPAALSYQPETGAAISGRAVTARGKPVAGVKVNLLVNVNGGLLLDTTTDAEGRFNFDKVFFNKGTTFNASAGDGKKDIEIEIDKRVNEPVTLKYPPDTLAVNNDFNTYMENSRKRFEELQKNGLLNRSIMLKEVAINEKRDPITIKKVATQFSENLAGPGNADQVLTFVDLLGARGFKDLGGMLNNIVFKGDNFFGGAFYARGFNSPMYIVIDGIGGRDLVSLVISDIASIEILRGGGAAALYGVRAGNGVIIISTKKGGVDYESYVVEHYQPGSTKPKGLKTYIYPGFDLRRQFYMPDYDNPVTNKQIPDLRTTIYWNPNILTNDKGKASVDFFNADGTGTYRVITEGLDSQGKLGRQVLRYLVK